jgi:hypothetical protein
MKDPLRLDPLDHVLYGAGVGQVNLVKGDGVFDLSDTPRSVTTAHSQVNPTTFLKQSPYQIGSYKTSSTGN